MTVLVQVAQAASSAEPSTSGKDEPMSTRALVKSSSSLSELLAPSTLGNLRLSHGAPPSPCPACTALEKPLTLPCRFGGLSQACNASRQGQRGQRRLERRGGAAARGQHALRAVGPAVGLRSRGPPDRMPARGGVPMPQRSTRSGRMRLKFVRLQLHAPTRHTMKGDSSQPVPQGMFCSSG